MDKLHSLTDPAQYVLSYVKSQSEHFRSEIFEGLSQGFNGILGRVIEWLDFCKQVAEERANNSSRDDESMPDNETFYLNPSVLLETQNVFPS